MSITKVFLSPYPPLQSIPGLYGDIARLFVLEFMSCGNVFFLLSVDIDDSVDLETGIKDPHQPYKTLSKYRRIDGGAKYSPCFGMLCVSDQLRISLLRERLTVDGTVKVGDVVQVLEKGDHFFSKS
jgi:MOSC domain